MLAKKIIFATVLLAAGMSWQVNAQLQNADVYKYPEVKQQNYRYNINIPNLDDYETLKCDFHIHTVFSDGQVWPSQRVNEAWNQGLDAIAITDHIEHRPNKAIINSDLNKSFEIAQKRGEEIGILVIKGSEITRKKPLGHINALFIQDANKIDVPNELDAVEEAFKQGAFLEWNHPGWPNDTSTMYPVHKKLIAEKKILGAEVFNGEESYPKVMDWCAENGLTFMANTDLHYTASDYYREKLERPMTLVFAKERSVEGIKEALFAGRTLAYFNNHLAGKESLIREIIQKSIFVKVINPKKNTIEICNKSDISFSIKFGRYMYSIPVLANQVLRVDIPSGTDVTFTNCLIGQDKFVTMKLW
jgi:hypothetical protein